MAVFILTAHLVLHFHHIIKRPTGKMQKCVETKCVVWIKIRVIIKQVRKSCTYKQSVFLI